MYSNLVPPEGAVPLLLLRQAHCLLLTSEQLQVGHLVRLLVLLNWPTEKFSVKTTRSWRLWFGGCGYVPPVLNCLTWLTKWQHQHRFSNTTTKHHRLKTGLSWTFHWQAEHLRWWQGFVQPSHPGWTSRCSWQWWLLLGEHQVNCSW